MRESKKSASLQSKSFRSEKSVAKVPTFEQSLVYSLVFHVLFVVAIIAFTKVDSSIWRKPPAASTVVWTQAVKRPKPTIPDKLPPPIVAPPKVEQPKIPEVNVKKEPTPIPEKEKKVEESREEKMKKVLENLKKNQVEDDRPPPREDNFPTAEPKKEGTLSETEIVALEASSIYSEYRQRIKEAIQSNLFWYKDQDVVALVSMKVDAQGNIANVRIEKSSGDSAFDQATLRAVQKSNPVPAPPDELKQLFLQETVVLNFERKKQ